MCLDVGMPTNFDMQILYSIIWYRSVDNVLVSVKHADIICKIIRCDYIELNRLKVVHQYIENNNKSVTCC